MRVRGGVMLASALEARAKLQVAGAASAHQCSAHHALVRRAGTSSTISCVTANHWAWGYSEVVTRAGIPGLGFLHGSRRARSLTTVHIKPGFLYTILSRFFSRLSSPRP